MPAYRLGGRSKYTVLRATELNDLGPGGMVIPFTASGDLKAGDAVYLSAAATVAKSTTASNHDKVIGIVIGGDSLGGDVVDDSALVGTIVALSGAKVQVLVQGVGYVVTAAAIAAGVSIVADTVTAGRVKASAAVTATGANPTQAASTIDAGATGVTSSGANGAIITNGAITQGAVTVAGAGMGRIIGRMLNASSGAGIAALAWINPQ